MGETETGIEEFTGEVDKAIDKLFDPSRLNKRQTDDSDNELLSYEEATKEYSGEVDNEQPDASPQDGSTLVEHLEAAVLTLEWEVTLANINRVLELLEIFRNEFQPYSEWNVLVDHMEQVLDLMGKAPEHAPVSGPQALMIGVTLIGGFVGKPGNTLPPSLEDVNGGIDSLKGALPQPVGKSESISKSEPVRQSEPEPRAKVKSTPTNFPPLASDENIAVLISGGLHSALRYHVTVLKQLVSLISPAEKLFKKSPGYEKFYAILKSVRQKIVKQQSFYDTALLNDYRCVDGDKEVPIPEVLHYALQSHVTIFEQCVKRVRPAEKAFGKASGMEKFYALHRRIREQLEVQTAFLARVSDGQYRSASSVKKTAAQVVTSCPYQAIITAKWGGKTVAFAADHVAYEGNVAWWARGKVQKQERFPLCYLKPWPWSKLRAQMTAELAKQRENKLAKLVMPILNHPGPFQRLNRLGKVNEIIVLQYKDSRAAVFLDSEPKSVAVSKQWAWEPSTAKDSIVAGYLDMDGEQIPVATLEKIQQNAA